MSSYVTPALPTDGVRLGAMIDAPGRRRISVAEPALPVRIASASDADKFCPPEYRHEVSGHSFAADEVITQQLLTIAGGLESSGVIRTQIDWDLAPAATWALKINVDAEGMIRAWWYRGDHPEPAGSLVHASNEVLAAIEQLPEGDYAWVRRGWSPWSYEFMRAFFGAWQAAKLDQAGLLIAPPEIDITDRVQVRRKLDAAIMRITGAHTERQAYVV